jgi:type VI secretion system protein ImpE
MSDQGAAALLRAGHLADAITAAQTSVRKAPTDIDARVLLAELLLFAGNLERADVLLDAATALDPTTSLVAAEFRQLIRADMARRQFFRDGRVPEFLGEPTEVQALQLATLVSLRAGDIAEATKQAAAAEAVRPLVPGWHDDVAFDDLRDADDLISGTMEVLTTTGKYYWIPIERIVSAEFHKPKRPRDLMWRRASMTVADGPDGDVYVPAIYVADEPLTDAQRLGRETDWRELEGGLVRGVGQRVFLAGEDGLDIMALGTLRFSQ